MKSLLLVILGLTTIIATTAEVLSHKPKKEKLDNLEEYYKDLALHN